MEKPPTNNFFSSSFTQIYHRIRINDESRCTEVIAMKPRRELRIDSPNYFSSNKSYADQHPDHEYAIICTDTLCFFWRCLCSGRRLFYGSRESRLWYTFLFWRYWITDNGNVSYGRTTTSLAPLGLVAIVGIDDDLCVSRDFCSVDGCLDERTCR